MPGLQAEETPNTASHYNNWPNEIGFNANQEQKTPVELTVTGSIPTYAAGTLYRTGPGRYKVDTVNGDTFKVGHWFDGFSQAHRFQLIPPSPEDAVSAGMRVFYNSRFSTDDLIEHVRQTGTHEKFTFGGVRVREDPCKIMYQKVQSVFEPKEAAGKNGAEEEEAGVAFSNVGVTLSINMPGFGAQPVQGSDSKEHGSRFTHTRTLHAKTDTSSYKQLDPETLEPLAVSNQAHYDPLLSGPLSASHAKSDPKTGDMYNYNCALEEEGPVYRVFRVLAATGETEILATFPATPAYLHSIFLTGDYVVVCVWSSHLDPEGFEKGFYLGGLTEFDPSIPAKWYIVDRKEGKGLVGTYDSDPFFCFHSINAWEDPNAQDPSKKDIVAEAVTFETNAALFTLYYDLLVSSTTDPDGHPKPEDRDDGGKLKSRITRFRLPAIPSSSAAKTQDREAENGEEEDAQLIATTESTTCQHLSPELPTLNPSYITVPHRYTYAVVDRGHSTFFDGIMKFDSTTKECLIWSEHAQSPGEAIFVPNPQGEKEDDGVLLSVVLNGLTGKSYLLVLDAGTLEEVGRASMQGVVGFGFHGAYAPDTRAGFASGEGATGDF
ncbi:carotenoid oxygenase [Aspergillus karnatakaensis]|uniref:carotenoid oxygenase family protein n=1 Tax=Aspergillus karnatakaensis TaxID=1810916 RepID=UPI003CCD511C